MADGAANPKGSLASQGHFAPRSGTIETPAWSQMVEFIKAGSILLGPRQ
jgi:hypothetical protein